MIVDTVEIPVCKPCPRCGMPSIRWRKQKDTIRLSISCSEWHYHIGDEAKDIADAIAAWNLLVAGVQKSPAQSEPQFNVVRYERKVKPIKKYGSTVSVSNIMLDNMDVHIRQQVIHDEIRRCYHKIADVLCDDCIGQRKTDVRPYPNDVIMNVSLQVVDDR